MGTKVTLDTVTNLQLPSALPEINGNFTEVADEFDKVLYKDGSAVVTGNLDMNSNRIINLPDAIGNTEPVTLGQLTNRIGDIIAPAIEAVRDEFEADLASSASNAASAASSALTATLSGTQAALYAQQAVAAAGSGGYFYHPVTLTRFKYGIIDGEVKPIIYPHIYLDPINGSDAANGLTAATPIKTSAAFYSHALFGTGVVLAIKRGSEDMRDTIDLAEPNTGNGNRQLSQFSVVDYGEGALRRINCTDIASNASFTAHGSIANAYQINWTHKLWATATARIRVFENGEPLRRVATEAGCSVAGTYWYDGTLDPTGAAERVVVHAWDNSNVTSNGKTYELTRRQYAVSGRDNCYFQGLHGYANGHNNGTFFCYDNAYWSTLIAEQGTKHNWVAGPGVKQDVISVNCLDGVEEYGAEGGLLAVTFLGDASGKVDRLTRVGAIIDTSIYAHTAAGSGTSMPFYTHSVSGSGMSLVAMEDCWENNTANSSAMTADQVTMNRHYGGKKNGSSGGYFEALGSFNHLTVTNSVFIGFNRGLSGQNLTVDRCYFNSYPTAGQTALYSGSNANNWKVTNNIFSDNVDLSTVLIFTPGLSNITVRNNVFCKVFAGPNLGTDTTAMASTDWDYNYYGRYDSNDLGGGRFFIRYKGVDEAFATWQGHGFDTHSVQALGTGSHGGWVSGSDPDQHGDIRLVPTSPAYPFLANPLTYSEVQDIMSKPLTLAASKTFMQSSVSHIPVYAA